MLQQLTMFSLEKLQQLIVRLEEELDLVTTSIDAHALEDRVKALLQIQNELKKSIRSKRSEIETLSNNGRCHA